jgi:hypothetical protein
MTSNLFTGLPGAENLPALAQNVEAQVKATVTNFQQAQTALTQAGVMTGKEAPAQNSRPCYVRRNSRHQSNNRFC